MDKDMKPFIKERYYKFRNNLKMHIGGGKIFR